MSSLKNNCHVVHRITTYGSLSTKLALLSDQHLLELLDDAQLLGTNLGGTTALLKIEDKNVFVKKVTLSDIEKQTENIMSTANLFSLPLHAQYGVSFGVWRELAVHIMTTNWVLTNECLNFPLMYHWRRLPIAETDKPTNEYLKKSRKNVALWDKSPAIRARYEASFNATTNVVFFLEFIPETLDSWLPKQLTQVNTAESACAMVENSIKAITSFINSRGLLHFDMHFMNILTDGYCLYLTDFGAAASSQFDLSQAESIFLAKHHNYDRCFSMSYFTEWALNNLFGSENWFTGNYNGVLHQYPPADGRLLAPPVETIVMRYLTLAVLMKAFILKFKKFKKTPYPTDELDHLCEKLDL